MERKERTKEREKSVVNQVLFSHPDGTVDGFHSCCFFFFFGGGGGGVEGRV